MKISEFFIDGFGLFHNKLIKDISPGLTVIKGPNEAGKSTILAFIRRIIFGFPKNSNRINQYQPLNGGTPGGRLSVRTKNGKGYNLERLSRNTNFSVSAQDGSEADAGINQIIGSADQNLFENVFAFGLDELQTFDTLSGDSIQNQLMSAGAGMTKIPIPDVIKGLNDKKRDLYYSGERGGPKISQEINKIKDIDSELKRFSDTQDEYEKYMHIKTDTEIKINGIKKDKNALLTELKDKEKVLNAWGDWIDFSEAKENLSQLTVFESFPEKGTDKLEQLNEKIKDLNENRDVENIKSDRTKENISEVVINENVISNKDNIRILEKGLEKYISDNESINKLEKDNNDLTNDLNTEIHAINSRWTVDNLTSFDLSQTAKADIDKFRSGFFEKEQDLRQKEIKREKYEDLISETNSKINILKVKLPKPEGLIPKEELTDRMKILENLSIKTPELNQKKSELNQIKEKEAFSKTDYDQKRSLLKNKIPVWPAGLLFIAGVISLLIGFSGNATEAGAAIFLILIISAVIFYISVKKTNEQNSKILFYDSDNSDQEILNISRLRQDYESDVSRREAEILRDARECGFSQIPDLSVISVKRHEYDSIRIRIDEYDRISDEINQLIESMEQQKRELSVINKEIDDTRLSVEKYQDDWENWLNSVHLDLNITPENALDVFSSVKEAGNIYDLINKNEEHLKDLTGKVSVYKEHVSEVLISCNESSANSVESDVNRLVEIFERNQKESHNLESLVAEERRLTDSIEQYSSQIIRFEDEKLKLLKEGFSDDEKEFTDNWNTWKKVQELQNNIKISESRLKKASGNIAKSDEFISILKETDFSELNAKITELKSRIEDFEQEIGELKTLSGEVKNELSNLEKDDESSLLAMESMAINEDVHEDSRKWAKYVIAQYILKEAVKKYESERQPEVYRLAQDYFRSITNGKYQKIIKPIDSDNILIEAENGHRIDTGSLSKGTAEQLYLAIRFGHISVFGNHNEPLPVIFDDILVNFDPERKRNCCDAILELSKTNQILFFTCHPDIVQILQEKSKDLKVIDLEGI